MGFALIILICFLFFVIFYIASKLNRTVDYYFKFTVYYAIINSIATFLIPFILITGKSKNVENYRYVSYWTCKLCRLYLNYDIEIRNLEYTVRDDSCIVICNHQTSVDMISMMEVWPDRCTSFVKKELMFAGPFGLAAWLCGTIFIDRLNREKAKESMNKTVNLIKENKIKVWIFPEGTRHIGKEMLAFKKGAFHIAVQGQIPLIPVVNASYYNFMSKKEKRFQSKGKILTKCLPPVSTVGLTAEDVDSLIKRCRDQMQATYNELTEELENKCKKKEN